MSRLGLRIAAMFSTARTAALAAGLFAIPSLASAADCGNTAGGFGSWLARFKVNAAAQGISPETIASALGGVTYDPGVIRLDRGQHSFKQSFEEFYARRAGGGLVAKGRSLMRTHRATLDRMEQKFGVPAAVVISIWGLETGYGAVSSGRMSILRSLATLAYDCRRSDFFLKELMAALQIVERGDMTSAQMRGGWAGEIGQTQFLPTAYVKFAVDFDGDGRRDLVRSVPDALASTANFLKSYGWQSGQSWLPGTANYAILQQWNRAEVYSRTIAVMSTKMAAAP